MIDVAVLSLLIVCIAAGAIGTARNVGKVREPTTPGITNVIVVIDVLFIVGLFHTISVLLHV